MKKAYFIGIDVGTQGARIVLLDEKGLQLGCREEVFPLNERSREEQDPLEWWACCSRLMPALVKDVRQLIVLSDIRAIAVTSTSGTVIPVDDQFNPLHPAIMYSDPRAAQQADLCREIAASEVQHGFKTFNASSGLPKMRWFMDQYPGRIPKIWKFIHAADFITGRLCGEYGVTDHTNAMKSGYDIHKFKWPDYITRKVGIKKEWLQQVRPAGELLGRLQSSLARAWGLPEDIQITTPVTDGCASQIASGAVAPGQWNTTIGTTLVIKGVTTKEVPDPSGAIYHHRHPGGYWMPGGASNTGADWVSRLFDGADLHELSQRANGLLPATSLAWPLMQLGERFPFIAPQARGFWPAGHSVETFAACMEGVAFIERYAFDKIRQLSGEKVEKVFTAGGGSKSDTWLRIRSSVLNVPVCRMKNVSGAAGAAILAASGSFYSSLQEAAVMMVHPEAVMLPETSLAKAYQVKYRLFIGELKTRKILD